MTCPFRMHSSRCNRSTRSRSHHHISLYTPGRVGRKPGHVHQDSRHIHLRIECGPHRTLDGRRNSPRIDRSLLRKTPVEPDCRSIRSHHSVRDLRRDCWTCCLLYSMLSVKNCQEMTQQIERIWLAAEF